MDGGVLHSALIGCWKQKWQKRNRDTNSGPTQSKNNGNDGDRLQKGNEKVECRAPWFSCNGVSSGKSILILFHGGKFSRSHYVFTVLKLGINAHWCCNVEMCLYSKEGKDSFSVSLPITVSLCTHTSISISSFQHLNRYKGT